MHKDFLSIKDLSVYEFNALMDLAENIKGKPLKFKNRLNHKILALMFQAPSLGARATSEVGMLQMGGNAVFLSTTDIGMDFREKASVIGTNLERWVDGIAVLALDHSTVLDLAAAVSIPVINTQTDLFHPCQGMADFFTLREKRGDLSKITLAYIGRGDGICHSLLMSAAKAGCRMQIATPADYEPRPEIMKLAEESGLNNGFSLFVTRNPDEAAANADVIYTSIWEPMDPGEKMENKAGILAPYQINSALMKRARPGALFMHGFPERRQEEVTSEVVGSDVSVVFEQVENRLHMQKAIMLSIFETRTNNE
jgi:ornithine carbamoyltransferase